MMEDPYSPGSLQATQCEKCSKFFCHDCAIECDALLGDVCKYCLDSTLPPPSPPTETFESDIKCGECGWTEDDCVMSWPPQILRYDKEYGGLLCRECDIER